MTQQITGPTPHTTERPVGLVRGTRDRLAADCERLDGLERLLLDRFARAGYRPLRTPVLEFTELHERKSGAGIVSKLFGLAGGDAGPVCLRPELTASVVRAYTAADPAPSLPWRVAAAGPVFRYEREPQEGTYREFTQVGVELLGAGGPAADAEVVALADRAIRGAGVADATVRIGHVGLILEVLERSGLPPVARAALVEMLSEAAAEGGDVRALESALEQLAGWLRSGSEAEAVLPAVAPDDGGVDRLFRQLVPDVTGRRSGHEIVGRLRRKWDLAHTLHDVLARVGEQIRELADLRGPAPAILDRLETRYRALAPDSVQSLRRLVDHLDLHGVAADRIELDLGFGRGIGFYSRVIFELIVPTPEGPIEVCGGGRYDGLARVLGSDRDDRGIGFAFGLERLDHALRLRGAAPSPVAPRGVLVVPSTPDVYGLAIRAAERLRDAGATAVVEEELAEFGRERERAFARAESLGLARVLLVRGGLSAGAMVVHDVATRAESALDDDGLARLGREQAAGVA